MSEQKTPFGPGWRRSAARRAKASRASELRPGFRGKLVGAVEAVGPLLVSPLTKTPCVLWAIEIGDEERVTRTGIVARIRGSSEVRFRSALETASSDAFYLVDALGERILVDPANALFDLQRTRVTPPRRDDPELGTLLLAHGMTPGQVFAKNADYMFFESLLRPQDSAGAWGMVMGLDRAIYRTCVTVRRRIASTRMERVVVFDGAR